MKTTIEEAVEEFTCPHCGGHCYGTSGPLEAMVGFCHGITDDHGDRPCHFTWGRNSDWRYFRMVVRTVAAAESEEEWEKMTKGDFNA